MIRFVRRAWARSRSCPVEGAVAAEEAALRLRRTLGAALDQAVRDAPESPERAVSLAQVAAAGTQLELLIRQRARDFVDRSAACTCGLHHR